jgi:hypothetical protein
MSSRAAKSHTGLVTLHSLVVVLILQIVEHVARGSVSRNQGEGHAKQHLPGDRVSYVPTWQSDVINGELAIPTIVGTWQWTRMSPRTGNPHTGLIALHSFVIVLVGVTLQPNNQWT